MKRRALVLLAVVAMAAPAAAYWAPNHMEINRQVFNQGTPWGEGFKRGSTTIVSATQYLSRVLYVRDGPDDQFKGVGLDKTASASGIGDTFAEDVPSDAAKEQHRAVEWVAQGGLWEDGFDSMGQAAQWAGRRAVNHFHDPLHGSGGYTGFIPNNATGIKYVDVYRSGISATEWVMNGSSGGGKNAWGYPTIGEQLHLAFSVKEQDEREKALANALRAIGQVQHLIEDNTVPDHARDRPHLGALTGHDFASAPGSLPLNPIASDSSSYGENAIENRAWENYKQPLMSRAHGYAQSVLSLAFQPARAEIVTGQNGDLLTMAVRLWNLWPASGPNSVTWHVDEVTIVNASQFQEPFGSIDYRPTVIPAKFDVAPGGSGTTAVVKTSWARRAAFQFTAHSAVLVTAHLGDAKQTPLKFAVPLVNALPLIKQTGTVDLSPPFVNLTGDCSTSSAACQYKAENATYRNPLAQRVTGTIELMPAEVDIVGRQGDPALVQAQKEDARIAEVMLFALPRSESKQDMVPVKAVNSQLELTGSKLTKIDRGDWVRAPDAEDIGDQPISFTAELDLRDFYFPDRGVELLDATRASGSVYLGVLTTAGAFYAQRLILWPLRHRGEAAAVTTVCKLDTPRVEYLPDNRTLCSESSNGQTPCGRNYQLQKIQALYGDNGAGGTELNSAMVIAQGLALTLANDVRPLSFGGQPINLTGATKRALDCDITQVSAVWPYGNGTVACSVFPPAGLALYKAANTMGTGSCPDTANLPLNRTAKYQRFFFPEGRALLQQVFGFTKDPAEWTFELN